MHYVLPTACRRASNRSSGCTRSARSGAGSDNAFLYGAPRHGKSAIFFFTWPVPLFSCTGCAGADFLKMVKTDNSDRSDLHGVFSLTEGQKVLDLGCGPGFDVFLAGQQVGSTGWVIGVDNCTDMLFRARENVIRYTERTGFDNVEFRLGEIENLPVTDASIDVVLANSASNHFTDSARVWSEIFRVLRPGGKALVTQLALARPLPENIRQLATALIACVSSAALPEEIALMIERAGFTSVFLTQRPEHLRHLYDWNDPLFVDLVKALPDDRQIVDYVTSLNIIAHK